MNAYPLPTILATLFLSGTTVLRAAEAELAPAVECHERGGLPNVFAKL